MVGMTDYNVDLSQRRADAVAAALRYRLSVTPRQQPLVRQLAATSPYGR